MPLPVRVVTVTAEWLNGIDAALTAMVEASRGFDPAIASRLTPAVGYVAGRTAHFRQALVGHTELSGLLPARWTPLGSVDESVAQTIYGDVLRAASLPDAFVEAAHSDLVGEEKKAFLRQVGDVAGTAFVNLARRLWHDHPHFALPGWDPAT